MARNQSRWTGGLLAGLALASAGCGSAASGPGITGSSGPRPSTSAAPEASLPPGVMSAAQACHQVIEKSGRGLFTRVERVHLVLTTYAKGEPVESQGDISFGMPPQTLVWVVEVHAQAIHWNHSRPPGIGPPARPDNDYSVVMNARTSRATDSGECACWPLPLSKAGTVVSLPPAC